jgi:acyl-CoA thioester hydrolase
MPQIITTGIELRFSDLDVYGHVNNSTYFTFLEIARVSMFKEFYEETPQHVIFTLVARVECDYKVQIGLHDHVMVSIWISRLGRTSYELEYRLHDGGETTYATARTVMVCFDSIRNTTVPVPEAIKAMV